MLEQWKKALDKKHIAGALLTGLSKAFDCINHELNQIMNKIKTN